MMKLYDEIFFIQKLELQSTLTKADLYESNENEICDLVIRQDKLLEIHSFELTHVVRAFMILPAFLRRHCHPHFRQTQ